jgi:hypothetical protein
MITEEEIYKIKQEALEQSDLAMAFASPRKGDLEELGANAALLMRVSFIEGARFAMRLFEERG